MITPELKDHLMQAFKDHIDDPRLTNVLGYMEEHIDALIEQCIDEARIELDRETDGRLALLRERYERDRDKTLAEIAQMIDAVQNAPMVH